MNAEVFGNNVCIFADGEVDTVQFGPFDAITPKIKGKAHITGIHEFALYADDQIGQGFMLR